MARNAKSPTGESGVSTPANRRRDNVPAIGEATQWKPGQSGNPAGRPKSTTAMKQMFATLTDDAFEIISLRAQLARMKLRVAVDVINDPNATPEQKLEALAIADSIGLGTVQEILDRGHGKPQQKVEMTSADVFADMTPEEKLNYIIENTPKVLAGLKGE